MDKEFICYCGLYCGNCAIKAKVEPAAKVLYEEMKKAGFEDIIHFIPDGESFWRFLKSTAEESACISCKAGSGNPHCEVRICAKDKGVDICALCKSYPCEKFEEYFKAYPILKNDNTILQKQDIEAWGKLQDERRKKGFTYTD